MDPTYRIGIEIELLLAPSDISFRPHEKLRIVTDHIISKCNPSLPSTAQLRNRVDKQCRRPQYWSLKKDNSVVADKWNTCISNLLSHYLHAS